MIAKSIASLYSLRQSPNTLRRWSEAVLWKHSARRKIVLPLANTIPTRELKMRTKRSVVSQSLIASLKIMYLLLIHSVLQTKTSCQPKHHRSTYTTNKDPLFYIQQPTSNSQSKSIRLLWRSLYLQQYL